VKNPEKTNYEVKILPTSNMKEGKKDQIQDAEIVNPSAHKAMGNFDKSTRETIVAKDGVKQPKVANEVEEEEEEEDRENEEGRN
jgi:hypothetical protein